MVNAQEYINQKYPSKAEREKITTLDLRNKELEGDLSLVDFKNLKKLNCGNNELVGLDLTNCQQLTDILCRKNNLTKLILPKSPNNLQRVFCWNNFLTDLDFSVLDGEKLTSLSLSNNDFSERDLSCFSSFSKLEELYLGTVVQERIAQGIYNRWTGSLEFLKNLNRLEKLRIDNTDVSGGVEYLPKNIKEVFHSSELRPEGKIREIKWQLDLFKSKKQKNWEELGFDLGEIKKWVEIGLMVYEYDLANFLQKEKKLNLETVKNELGELREEHDDFIWRGINSNSTHELQKKWQGQIFSYKHSKDWRIRGFSYEECKEWLNIGMKFSDSDYCAWLRDVEKKNPEYVLKLDQEKNPRDRYTEYFLNNKLSKEIIEQIKEFNHSNLTSEQKLLVDELISNEKLRERYKNYGLCKKCGQPNTGKRLYTNSPTWCRFCNAQNFRKEFKNWTSGNPEIDQFIQDCQLNSINPRQVLEWIPYDRLINVEYLAEGGFGKVYKAERLDGYIYDWNDEEKRWERSKINPNGAVVLKSLNNSQDITTDFLHEIVNHKLFHDDNFIVKCYGISQELKTKNYVMVMDYVNGGNLRQFLKKECRELDFRDKFNQLVSISEGLSLIHEKGLVHRDFHSGNILSGKDNTTYQVRCWINDLGLSRPANEKEKEGVVYGVLPYVDPEVLNKNPYTQASDIYSFGMVAYELFSGSPPYYDYEHDISLALKICQGKRPQFQIKISQLLEDLIKQCWDTDPSKRPTARELSEILRTWNGEIKNKKDTEFYRQCQEAEEFNKSLPDSIKFPKYEKHERAVYHSRLLPTKEISELLNNEIYASKDIGLSINDLLEELNIGNNDDELENNELVAQIQVPPKTD